MMARNSTLVQSLFTPIRIGEKAKRDEGTRREGGESKQLTAYGQVRASTDRGRMICAVRSVDRRAEPPTVK